MEKLPAVLEAIKGEERELIFSAPVWISLFAAYRHDGKIDPAEKSEAIRQSYFRTFTSPNALNAYYEVVDHNFADKFNDFNATLPDGEEARDRFLEDKIHKIVDAVKNLPDDWLSKVLMEDLNEFYLKVFRADNNIFQYFALPLISKRFENDDENLDEI